MSKKELKEVIERLSKKMNQAAAELNFELAAQLRDELKELRSHIRNMTIKRRNTKTDDRLELGAYQ